MKGLSLSAPVEKSVQYQSQIENRYDVRLSGQQRLTVSRLQMKNIVKAWFFCYYSVAVANETTEFTRCPFSMTW